MGILDKNSSSHNTCHVGSHDWRTLFFWFLSSGEIYGDWLDLVFLYLKKNTLAQFEKCVTQTVYKLGSCSSSCSIFEHQKVASFSISDLGLVPGSRYVCSPRVPSPPPLHCPVLPNPYSALTTQPAHPQVDVQKSPSSDLICATSSLAWLLRCLKSPLRSLRNSWGRLAASLIPRTFRALARGIQMGDFRHVQKFCSAWTKDVFFGKLCIYLQSDILPILYFRRYKALTQFL